MAFALGSFGCTPPTENPPTGSGGASAGTGGATGGATAGAGGATGATGGASPGTGGTASGSGGSASGGSPGTGGAAPGTGGVSTGGASATGGASTGGQTGTGGGAQGGAGTGGRGTGGGAQGGAGGRGTGGAGGGPPIVDLFNGTDLTGWTAYRETAATSPGTTLTSAQAQLIFKPEGGSIRVYGDHAQGTTQARHTLVTAMSYSKYNFFMEYRWGTKTFAPYANTTQYPRDAGILFHLHRAPTQVWPPSIEFQIKDGTTGDIFALYARCTSLARNGGTTFVDTADGGTSKVINGATGFVGHTRSANFEVPDWNALEMQVNGGTAVYIVNGHIVNRVLGITDSSGSAGSPVTSGPIALQAEHAETFYRNIRIQVLP